MTRIASRLGIVALPLALGGCFVPVSDPYDEPYYASPPAVVVERPAYHWYTPGYRVSERHVYARDRHPRARHGRDHHDDHDRDDGHHDHDD